MNYLAINIGPIIKTFSMARKPREFWAASYMFSYLMECILNHLDNNENLTLVSPFYQKGCNRNTGVGLFPDRIYYSVKRDVDIHHLTNEAVKIFSETTGINHQVVKRYFNIMTTCGEYDSDSAAIKGLNITLNIMEFNQKACLPEDQVTIQSFLNHTTNKAPSPLFRIAFGESKFSIETLEEIALAGCDKAQFSHQKYVCIVQADGDNMGTIVQSDKMNVERSQFSEDLMNFGKNACKKIREFGGRPIYAGGDDLLFIAPVCGKENSGTILDLIGQIDELFAKEIKAPVSVEDKDKNNKEVNSSMSYGVSIIYHKYPLYEAWEIARNMLFSKAKEVPGKNAIAVNLRKNSGSDFEIAISKSSDAYVKLNDLIRMSPDETLVSSVAHKFRANEALLDVLPKENGFEGLDDRLSVFYEKIIDAETKSDNESTYLTHTKELFEIIYKDVFIEKRKKEETKGKNVNKEPAEPDIHRIISNFYSMLRMAKFIKGEGVKDE